MGKKLSQQKNYDSPPKSSKENIKKAGWAQVWNQSQNK